MPRSAQPSSVPALYIGAIVQGLLIQAPTRIATRLSRSSDREHQRQAGMDPEQREESDEDAEPERRGHARGAVFDLEQDLAHPAQPTHAAG